MTYAFDVILPSLITLGYSNTTTEAFFVKCFVGLNYYGFNPGCNETIIGINAKYKLPHFIKKPVPWSERWKMPVLEK